MPLNQVFVPLVLLTQGLGVEARSHILQSPQQRLILPVDTLTLDSVVILIEASHQHWLTDWLRVSCQYARQLIEENGVLVHNLVIALLFKPRTLRVGRLWPSGVAVVNHWLDMAQI